MILGVCSNSSILETMRIIKIVIRVITIIVPIALIVSMSITFTKQITSNEGSNKKAFESVIRKMIAAIAIFLFPILVGIAVKMSSDDFEYKECIESATKEGIYSAKVKEASDLVDIAESSLTSTDYEIAKIAVSKLDNSSSKTKLVNRLNNINTIVDLKKQIDDAYVNGTEDDYKRLLNEVNKLPASKNKNELLIKLKLMKKRIDDSKVPDVEAAIGEIGGSNPPKQKVNNKNITLNYYKASTGQGFSYWLYVPENATANMPIVIFIHGLGERGNDYYNGTTLGIVSGPIREINRGAKNYDAIIIQPQIPSGDKSQNYGTAIVELTNKLASKLNANTKKISISGFSNGCYGVFAIVNQYQNYFSAALALGCTPSNANAFKTTPLWTMVGSGDGVGTMPPFVEQVKKINGGKAWHTQVPHSAHNITHDTNYSVFTEYKVVEWMISETRN